METNPKLNQKLQEKHRKIINKHSKINKNHLQKRIWPLQGLQVGQHGSTRGPSKNFGGPLGPPWGPKNHQKVKKMMSKNRSNFRMIYKSLPELI